MKFSGRIRDVLIGRFRAATHAAARRFVSGVLHIGGFNVRAKISTR
jgi:hypothetical protein